MFCLNLQISALCVRVPASCGSPKSCTDIFIRGDDNFIICSIIIVVSFVCLFETLSGGGGGGGGQIEQAPSATTQEETWQQSCRILIWPLWKLVST